MRRAIILVCIWSATHLAGDGARAASSQCLSPAELSNVGRMATVMAIGAAVRHCSRCLGPERYSQIVKTYQADGLMDDFWVAQKAVEHAQDKFAYIDELVRSSARNYSATLSADCDACQKTASMLKRLSSASQRDDFYRSETDAIAKNAKVKACP